jgi:hypothetical protein
MLSYLNSSIHISIYLWQPVYDFRTFSTTADLPFYFPILSMIGHDISKWYLMILRPIKYHYLIRLLDPKNKRPMFIWDGGLNKTALALSACLPARKQAHQPMRLPDPPSGQPLQQQEPQAIRYHGAKIPVFQLVFSSLLLHFSTYLRKGLGSEWNQPHHSAVYDDRGHTFQHRLSLFLDALVA